MDPQRFRGNCYKAAGWQQLGPTQGYERGWQDFYTDTQHPKELWFRPLSATALEQLRAPELPPALADPKGPLPPACSVATDRLKSLWEYFHSQMTDPRHSRGVALPRPSKMPNRLPHWLKRPHPILVTSPSSYKNPKPTKPSPWSTSKPPDSDWWIKYPCLAIPDHFAKVIGVQGGLHLQTPLCQKTASDFLTGDASDGGNNSTVESQ